MGAMDSRVGALLARAGERVLELFGHDENVTGVGVGFRRRGGKVTDEPCVTVMVRKKRRPALVSRRRLIPAEIDVDGTAVRTDVVQAQAVLMNAGGTPGQLPERYRPLLFGAGVSNFSDARPDAGTLGAFIRDNTDGTTGILSANHVIADNNRAPRSDPIYQPASLDREEEEVAAETVIGRLKRWVTITGGATAVDGAIAQLESTVRVSRSYGGVETAAPSESRRAVGMIVAGDGFGNVWLTSMATTLRELNATLLPAGSNVETVAPALGTKLEKVGRTTAYTVARVLGTNQTKTVEVPGIGAVSYTGLIWTQWLGWFGDSGAMVIRKPGEGIEEGVEIESRQRISRLISDIFATCELLPAIQFAFGVPITRDAALSDDVRDEFMAQTYTGRYLITLTYLNTALSNRRLERRQTAEQQAYANSLYNHYQPLITELMANPRSTTRINEIDGENYFALLNALVSGGVLLPEERTSAYNLGRTWERTVLGMGRTELMTFMNRTEALNSVRTSALEMRALTQSGPARVMGVL